MHASIGLARARTPHGLRGLVIQLLRTSANSRLSNSIAGKAYQLKLRGERGAGIVEGTGGSLMKRGSDTLTLSGADAYTGPTTVSAGTLLVTGSTNASSAVRYGATATKSGVMMPAALSGG